MAFIAWSFAAASAELYTTKATVSFSLPRPCPWSPSNAPSRYHWIRFWQVFLCRVLLAVLRLSLPPPQPHTHTRTQTHTHPAAAPSSVDKPRARFHLQGSSACWKQRNPSLTMIDLIENRGETLDDSHGGPPSCLLQFATHPPGVAGRRRPEDK